jgi:hypothetical protein
MCVLLNPTYATVVSISFYLWMSYGGVDIFVLVIKFLHETEVPMHITMGLFKVNETVRKIIHDCMTISFVGQIWYVALSS